MVFCAIGIYSLNNLPFETYLTAIFGLVGFMWRKLGCPTAPMMLGFILGPMMEENLRRTLQVSRSDLSVFVTRPISLGFIVATVLILVVMLLPALSKRRDEITD